MKQSTKKTVYLKLGALITLVNICSMALGQDQELIQRAKVGDAKAQYELSNFFLYQKRDTANYIKWLKESAANNNPEAQTRLASRYALGDMGVNRSNDKYVYWLTKAAENGDPLSAYFLGRLYKNGENDVEVDEEKYLYWTLKAARGGIDLACYSLGLHYEDINKVEAIYWYKKYMDLTYEESGHEDEQVSIRLRKLGVYYHPDAVANSSSASTFPLVPSRKYKIIRTLMGDESRDFIGSDGYVKYDNRTIVVNLGFTTMEYVLKHSPKQELGGIFSLEVTYKGEDGKLSVINNGKTITIEPVGLSFPMGYEVTE